MLSLEKTTLIAALSLLSSFSLESHAVVRGKLAKGPAYAAVIGLYHCSGVVIHPRAILTAAHCKSNVDIGHYSAYLLDRNVATRINVKSIYVHEGYVDDVSWRGQFKINDDFALIVLSDPITDPTVLANIPKIVDESTLVKDETLTAVGMGIYRYSVFSTSDNGMDASEKRMAPYRIVEKRASTYFLNGLTRNAGICGGDSGGGLLRVSADETKSELVGILTASGGECGEPDQTDYAESVPSHLDWIKEKLAREGISGF